MNFWGMIKHFFLLFFECPLYQKIIFERPRVRTHPVSQLWRVDFIKQTMRVKDKPFILILKESNKKETKKINSL